MLIEEQTCFVLLPFGADGRREVAVCREPAPISFPPVIRVTATRHALSTVGAGQG